ncbi:hypothetical protein C2L64_50450 [Paraburkholderia hospita]|uniref:Uncharacterized protein n=1 Tax=Paraburkholderia hospita TaxID=169430 RepID=A0AAN1JLZ0_9BURK|nr:hypothetical protein [Paraburkholderia hospita]AUT76446.1 hypothetical protein C2L64_50450 [Paraburkholderia hospita]OUL79134.1 hypothetical protein CA603_33665 [Paraburkholderia hospita]
MPASRRHVRQEATSSACHHQWLRRHVGDVAIASAVAQCAGSGKPYLSIVCRRLGVRTPAFSVPRRQTSSPVAEHSLATIRGILAARTAPAKLVAVR